jgi:hypothetical protein
VTDPYELVHSDPREVEDLVKRIRRASAEVDPSASLTALQDHVDDGARQEQKNKSGDEGGDKRVFGPSRPAKWPIGHESQCRDKDRDPWKASPQNIDVLLRHRLLLEADGFEGRVSISRVRHGTTFAAPVRLGRQRATRACQRNVSECSRTGKHHSDHGQATSPQTPGNTDSSRRAAMPHHGRYIP